MHVFSLHGSGLVLKQASRFCFYEARSKNFRMFFAKLPDIFVFYAWRVDCQFYSWPLSVLFRLCFADCAGQPGKPGSLKKMIILMRPEKLTYAPWLYGIFYFLKFARVLWFLLFFVVICLWLEQFELTPLNSRFLLERLLIVISTKETEWKTSLL